MQLAKLILGLFATLIIDQAAVEGSGAPQDPTWLSTDCTKDDRFYYFVGRAAADSRNASSQGAMLDARKNALICVFGGTIDFKSSTSADNHDVQTLQSTSVAVSSAHIDWSGFEMIESIDNERQGSWESIGQFRWPHKEVQANKKRTDALAKERRK